jgi:hypothetical protein
LAVLPWLQIKCKLIKSFINSENLKFNTKKDQKRRTFGIQMVGKRTLTEEIFGVSDFKTLINGELTSVEVYCTLNI